MTRPIQKLDWALTMSKTRTAVATVTYHGHKFVLFSMLGRLPLITPRFAEARAYQGLEADIAFMLSLDFARWARDNVEWEPSNPLEDGLTRAVERLEKHDAR